MCVPVQRIRSSRPIEKVLSEYVTFVAIAIIAVTEHRANMLDIFLQVKSYLVLDRINVDNAVFRLHYKVTFLILVCCSIILSARQYLDDTIACLSAAKIPQVAMNAYWEVRINV